MTIDKSVSNFIRDPDQYLIKIVTKGDERVVMAEKKGGLSWIKAHLPSKYFGDYSLKNVVAALSNAEVPLKKSLNVIIKKYNDTHQVSSFAIDSTKQPETEPVFHLQKFSLQDIMAKARQHFETNPKKDAILRKIARYLDSYDASTSKTHTIFIGGIWEAGTSPTLGYTLKRAEFDDAIAYFFESNNFPGIETPSPELAL